MLSDFQILLDLFDKMILRSVAEAVYGFMK